MADLHTSEASRSWMRPAFPEAASRSASPQGVRPEAGCFGPIGSQPNSVDLLFLLFLHQSASGSLHFRQQMPSLACVCCAMHMPSVRSTGTENSRAPSGSSSDP